MKILSLKYNTERAIPAYEIIAESEDANLPSTVTIPAESEEGKRLKASLDSMNLGTLSKEDFQSVVSEILTTHSGVGVINAISDDSFASSRIKLLNGSVLSLNGEALPAPLTAQILKMKQARDSGSSEVSTKEWIALISFAENLANNVNPYIRKQLYSWLSYQISNGRLTLTDRGTIIGYKGVRQGSEGFTSIHQGPAIVDGVPVSGYVLNKPGSVIEIARDYVDDNPFQTCSRGLHIGSYDYAHSFSGGKVLSVEFAPEDVVSVPYDYNGQKIRACKYRVIDVVESQLDDFAISFEDEEADNDWESDGFVDTFVDFTPEFIKEVIEEYTGTDAILGVNTTDYEIYTGAISDADGHEFTITTEDGETLILNYDDVRHLTILEDCYDDYDEKEELMEDFVTDLESYDFITIENAYGVKTQYKLHSVLDSDSETEEVFVRFEGADGVINSDWISMDLLSGVEEPDLLIDAEKPTVYSFKPGTQFIYGSNTDFVTVEEVLNVNDKLGVMLLKVDTLSTPVLFHLERITKIK